MSTNSFTLSRNARVYVSTVATGFDDTNTKEIRVLDGFAFSQTPGTQEITVNEAGDTPTRGRSMFNQSLDPAEFSFDTYVRPYDDGLEIRAIEDTLWEAFAGPGNAAAGSPYTVRGATDLTVNFSESDVHQLQQLYIFFDMDGVLFRLTQAVLNEVTLDFDIDGISTLSWSGQARGIARVSDLPSAEQFDPTADTPIQYEAFPTPEPTFMVTKFITMDLASNIDLGSVDAANANYKIALTGGNITMNNNITYLTPEELGVINQPIAHFTGSREIGGTFDCYLKTTGGADAAGTAGDPKPPAQLFADLAAATNITTHDFDLKFTLRDQINNPTTCAFHLPHAHLVIPATDVQDVLSLSVDFVGLNEDNNLEGSNEAVITYTVA